MPNLTPPPPPPLKAELCQVFALGALDALAGQPVEDTDTITVELGQTLFEMANKCVSSGERELASLYPENPQLTYDTVYSVGQEIIQTIVGAICPAPISLN